MSAKNPSDKSPATTPVDDIDPKMRLLVARIMQAIVDDGELDIEIDDNLVAGQFTERLGKIETRLAQIEKQLSIQAPASTTRVDASALAAQPKAKGKGKAK